MAHCLLRHGDVIIFPVDKSTYFAYVPRTDSSKMLGTRDVKLLLACKQFRTLADHAEDYIRAQSPLLSVSLSGHVGRPLRFILSGLEKFLEAKRQREPALNLQISSTIKRLVDLKESGLLISYEQFLRYASQSTDSSFPIGSIAIPTRNRLSLLHRALVSYTVNVHRYGRHLQYLVVDGADDSSGDVLLMLQAISRRYDVRIDYAGRRQRLRFAKALGEATGLPNEILEFALLGWGSTAINTGACRNTILLATAGEAVVAVDDDSLCHFAVPPDTADGALITTKYDPTEFWFFPNQQSMSTSIRLMDQDFIDTHARVLSNSVGACVRDCQARDIVMEDDDGAIMLLEASKGRVVVSSTGVCGDAGIRSTKGYLFLEGSSRTRLLESESTYRNALMSREVLRCVRRLTLSRGLLLGINAAFDNRTLLPPFCPVQRNSDGIFALVLRTCFLGAYVCNAPVAIVHKPGECRSLTLEHLWASMRDVTSSELLVMLIESFHSTVAASDRGRFLALGDYLSDLGSNPQIEFDNIVRIIVAQSRSHRLQRAVQLLEKWGNQPGFWSHDVKEYIGILRASLLSGECVVPSDLQQIFGREEGQARFRRLVADFGFMLRHWPTIVDAARQLRANGIALAENVCNI